MARSLEDGRSPDQSVGSLPPPAKSTDPRRSGLARWQAWAPRQTARTRAAMAQRPLPRRSMHTESYRAAGPTEPLRRRGEHQSLECDACCAWTGKPSHTSAEKKPQANPGIESQWLTGAGGLLLLAAAQETDLLPTLEAALASCEAGPQSRLAHLTAPSRRMLLFTLLFLGAVGLRRTCDLRGYSGDALGVLTGRKRAYGYANVERFLSHLAHAGGAETFTHALGKWTARLWQSQATEEPATDSSPCFYVDGHRKPVYTEKLIPRGFIGRTGKILGCRALVLVHDEQGHPLQASTHRGDQHLTMGLAQLLPPVSQNTGVPSPRRVVVDREGMAAAFLRDLQAQGYTVITLLRTDQYDGLESFSDVGQFIPFECDQHGAVIREVALPVLPFPCPTRQVSSCPSVWPSSAMCVVR